MDLCSCGHHDDCHSENELLGPLEGCKHCQCKSFEWASSTTQGWVPSEDEDFEVDLDDDDDADWRLVH